MSAAFQLNAFQPNAFQTATVTGVIYATDQNDTALIIGLVGGADNVDTHDGFTHKEIKHLEKIRKKLDKLQQQKEQAFADANERRKKAILDVVEPPIAPIKEIEVELSQAIEVPVVDIEKLTDKIAKLDFQRQILERQIAQKQAIEAYQRYMAHLEAKIKAELEDEEALLMLL